jgi:hypothetical protein
MSELIWRRNQQAVEITGSTFTLEITLNQEPTAAWQSLYRPAGPSQSFEFMGTRLTIREVPMANPEATIAAVDESIARANQAIREQAEAEERSAHDQTRRLQELNARLRNIGGAGTLGPRHD